MKIGILTYHNAVNYGAILQTYALQEVIKKIICENVTVIDYHSPAVDSQYNYISYKDSGSLKGFVLSNVTTLLRKKKNYAFNEFICSNLICTPRVNCVSDDNLKNISTIVVGSDQVWNPACTNGDKNYLLSDVGSDKIKISYAASMGSGDKISEFSSKYDIDYKKYLKNFDAISCREKDAADFLSKELAMNCTSVVDPVFLYETDNWYSFVDQYDDSQKKKRNEHIFVYNLGNFLTLQKLVKKVKKETGLDVIVVNKDAKGDFMYLNCENKSNCAPQEFLYLLRSAKIVISDSFHATAFSIIFGKNFYTVGNSCSNNTNIRMKNILSHYGLERRYVINEIDSINVNEEIDYSGAAEILKNDRDFAINWFELQMKDRK